MNDLMTAVGTKISCRYEEKEDEYMDNQQWKMRCKRWRDQDVPCKLFLAINKQRKNSVSNDSSWTGDAGSNQLEARTPELAWFAVSSYWSQSNREASEDNGPKSGIRVSAFGPRSTTRTAQNALSYTWFSVFRRSGVAARQGTRFSKKGDIESPQKEGGFLIWQVWIAALLGFIN